MSSNSINENIKKAVEDIKKQIIKYTDNVNDTDEITSITEIYYDCGKEANEISKILESYTELLVLIRDKTTSLRQKYDTKSEEQEEEKEEEQVEKKKVKKLTKKEKEQALKEEAKEKEEKEEKIEEIEKEEEPKNNNKNKKDNPVPVAKKATKGKKKKDDD